MSNKTRPSMKNELARVHTSSSSQNSQFLKQSMKNTKMASLSLNDIINADIIKCELYETFLSG
jgi:hypothetical protein